MDAPPAHERGTLYVVSTPIGNLGDITHRAVAVLSAVKLVVAEDTRRTGRLLAHLGIKVPQLSFHAHNRRSRIGPILEALARGDVAHVTDAGSPSVSDPGQDLVAEARAAGFAVVPVPGPSALTAALMVAGVEADIVHFLGFLPRRAGDRRRMLEAAATWPGAIVFFEAPHRLVESIEDAAKILGDRRAAVCNDLTKRFEAISCDRLAVLGTSLRDRETRGEYTVVLAPRDDALSDPAPRLSDDPSALRSRMSELAKSTGDRREALRLLAAETRLPRKTLYAQLMARPDEGRGVDMSTDDAVSDPDA